MTITVDGVAWTRLPIPTETITAADDLPAVSRDTANRTYVPET
ncbi:MAG: hypothetical protein ACRDKS_04590 [Actinomycetota bacterium]